MKNKQNSIPPVIYSTENVFIQASNSHALIRVLEKTNEMNKPDRRIQIAESAVRITTMAVATFFAVKAIRKLSKKEKEKEDRK